MTSYDFDVRYDANKVF